jgi:hypothetical protein
VERNDFKRVERWLFSIPKKYIALDSLRARLDALDTKAASPPRWIPTLEQVPAFGGETESRQQRWVEFMEQYPVEREFLAKEIKRLEEALSLYERVMMELNKEDELYHRLIRLKYEKKWENDRVWAELHISKATFFRMRYRLVQTFYECLPGEFLRLTAA